MLGWTRSKAFNTRTVAASTWQKKLEQLMAELPQARRTAVEAGAGELAQFERQRHNCANIHRTAPTCAR
jgi:hypothetical protein